MRFEEIILLSEVRDDLVEGQKFYNANEKEVGDYFWDSLIADIESLLSYAGVHSKRSGLYNKGSKMLSL